MTIRFLADADLNHYIVTGTCLREPAIDFLSAANAALEGLSDTEVLAVAARQNRILVSHDKSSMPLHFAQFVAEGRISPGVFLVPQRADVRSVIESLVLIWSASSWTDWFGQIHHIPSLTRHVFQG